MQEKISTLCSYRPNLAFSIFCGVLKSDTISDNPSPGLDGTIVWQTHLFEDNSPNLNYDYEGAEKTRQLINKISEYYYPSFVNCLFPQVNADQLDASEVKSYTLAVKRKVQIITYSVFLNYIDFFYFPGNILIYCFRVDYDEFTLKEIIACNEIIRKSRPEDLELLKDFFTTHKLTTADCVGNKLKVFSVIDHSLHLDDSYSIDCLLYDFGTCSPVGTSIGLGDNPSLRPSKTYFSNLMTLNKISVFESWSALCLYDTLVVLTHESLNQFNWEFRYFRLLYIHSLFIKSFLSELNKEFYLNNDAKDLITVFDNFNRRFNIREISYNFLPQIIFERIHAGLDIDKELEDIRESSREMTIG